MNCSGIRQHLHELLDGESTDSIREEIDRHLEACGDCRQEYETLRSLVKQAEELGREVSPHRDLWPDIHAQIDSSRSVGSLGWLQWAAAALTLVVLSIPISAWWLGRSTPDSATSVVEQVEESSLAVRAERARSEDGVQLARIDLVTAIERHRDVIAADTLQSWEDSMTVLDQAIGELQAALEEDPQNLRLRMLLASRYQQERRLLQKVSRV